MSAIDELPDGDGENLPSGNCVPNLPTLKKFTSDLHETIVSQILDGRTQYCEILDGRRVIFRLPRKEQLYDFISVQSEANNALGIVLMIPSTQSHHDGEYEYHTRTFEYLPPQIPDTSYLPSFSQN